MFRPVASLLGRAFDVFDDDGGDVVVDDDDDGVFDDGALCPAQGPRSLLHSTNGDYSLSLSVPFFLNPMEFGIASDQYSTIAMDQSQRIRERAIAIKLLRPPRNAIYRVVFLLVCSFVPTCAI